MIPNSLNAPVGYFIDANLLVLLVVGSVGQDLIAKHGRLKEYTAEDYETLLDLLSQTRQSQIYVTPNTLTETSNLLAQHGEPERSLIMEGLRTLVEESREIVVKSATATGNSAFLRLGLTDAALLEAISEETPLVTADLDLYLAALEKAPYNTVNFTHIRRL